MSLDRLLVTTKSYSKKTTKTKQKNIVTWNKNDFTITLFRSFILQLYQVFSTLPDFESVRINYMVPGSITARITCAFRSPNTLTPDSLYAQLLTHLDKNNIIGDSKLGVKHKPDSETPASK